MSEKTFYVVTIKKGNDSFKPAIDMYEEMFKRHHLRLIEDTGIHHMMESIADECHVSFNNDFKYIFQTMPVIKDISRSFDISVCGRMDKEDMTIFKVSLQPISNSDEIRLVRKSQSTNQNQQNP